MKKIVVINGSGGSGKDEVVKITSSLIGNGEHFTTSVSSVEAVKDKAVLFGWSGKKDDKSRKLLCDLKTAWVRYNDGPFNYIKRYINNFHTSKNFIIFVHIREALEIEKMVDYYGDLIVTLLVKRDNIENFDNEADNCVEEYPYDYIIENNKDLNELEENTKIFLGDIGLNI